MSGTFVDVCNYYSSPRSTDPEDIIREKDIALWLRRELERVEAELAERERFASQLPAELAGHRVELRYSRPLSLAASASICST